MAADTQGNKQDGGGVAAETHLQWTWKRCLYGLDSALADIFYQTLFLLCIAVAVCTAGGRVLVETENDIAFNTDHSTSFSEGVWLAWSLFVDPASMPEAESLRTRVVAAIIVILGIGYFAIFLALVVDGVQAKMEALKHGLSPVVERGHTVILGWTDATVTIVREIAAANASEGGGCIAILCERDKRDMELELAALIKPSELAGTRVVFRAGSRVRSSDLHKVSAARARAVLVLSDPRLAPDAADADVLQTVLNLSTLGVPPGELNVVAEVRLMQNSPLFSLFGAGAVTSVASASIVGSLMLQFARQPGLASVYGSVLGFDGSEFYVRSWPELAGRTFGELQALLPAAVPLGIVRATDGACVLNPGAAYVLNAEDELVVLAEDDDSYAPVLPGSAGAAQAAAALKLPPNAPCFLPAAPARTAPERVLVAGWRHDIPAMMHLLDRLVQPGSECHIMCTLPLEARAVELSEAGVDESSLTNLKLVHHVGSYAVRRHLEDVNLERFTSVVVVADSAMPQDVIVSDGRGLTTLFMMRDVCKAHIEAKARGDLASLAAAPVERISAAAVAGEGSVRGGNAARAFRGDTFCIAPEVIASASALPIVVEILDPRTQRTVADSASVGLPMMSEFMQSNELSSKILAMVSEDAYVKSILDQLLGSEGTQFSVVPSREFVAPDADVSFAELARHAASRNCVLCGYIEPGTVGVGGNMAEPPRCVINPEDKAERRAWGDCNLVVVVTDHRLVASRAPPAKKKEEPPPPPQKKRGW